MKIQSLNTYNIKYYPKTISRPKNMANPSNFEGRNTNYPISIEQQRAYFLTRYNKNNLNFGSSKHYHNCSKDEFFKDFNPVEDYEYVEEFKNYAFSPGRVKKEDFEKLSKSKQRDYFMLSYDFFEKAAEQLDIMNPETIINYSKDLKNFFDEKYGKGKYRIIAPGTSPANIAQGMEYLGCEVIFLPFSDIRNILKKHAHSIDDIPFSYKDFKNGKIAMHYLKHKGVGQDNDRKINVVLDYTAKGNTIYCVAKFLYEFLKEEHPFRRSKVRIHSLIDTIQHIENKKMNYMDNVKIQSDLDSLKYLCCISCLENVSPVPHFSIISNCDKEGYIDSLNKTEKQVFKDFDNYSTPLSKIYSLCLLEEAQFLNK